MGETKIIIYGLECTVPEQPKLRDIAGYGVHTKKQKFQRTNVPESFEEISFDTDGNPIYSDGQIKFISTELTRCDEGFWFYNNGTPTYVTGLYYYYLNFWTLENGKKPEYRESDRLFFIFFDTCYNHPKIKGIIRGKKRREGATSQGTCASVKIATFAENQRVGSISKTGTDAEDLFQNMIVYGYFALPVFLQTRVDASTNPKTKLNFVEPAKKGASANKGRTITKRQGLNSWIDWRNTALNSYDSGRFSFIIIDEAGKWEKVDIKKYWSIVKQVLVEGGSKKGMAYIPSTVNEPSKGGEGFKYLWENSNQFIDGIDTTTEMVKFFQPAWEGLAGFIDEYGFSVIEPPDAITLKYLIDKQLELPAKERIPDSDLKKGAKKYLEDQLAKIKDDEARNEQKRMYPTCEKDMFDHGDKVSPFNLDNITAQKEWLNSNPQFLRRGKLSPELDDSVDFKDDEAGKWEVLKLPKIRNRYVRSGKEIIPGNTHSYVGGVDPFRLNTIGAYSSKGVIWIFELLDPTDPENTCMPIAKYKGRPKEKDLFFEECLLAFKFWGCKGTFEMDATDDYEKYFKERHAIKLLNWTPDEAIGKTAKGKSKRVERGVRSADPFALEKQLKVAVSYVEHHCHKIMFPSLLEDLENYDHSERTARDETVAFMMCLLTALGTTKSEDHEKKRGKMVETYSVNIYSK